MARRHRIPQHVEDVIKYFGEHDFSPSYVDKRKYGYSVKFKEFYGFGDYPSKENVQPYLDRLKEVAKDSPYPVKVMCRPQVGARGMRCRSPRIYIRGLWQDKPLEDHEDISRAEKARKEYRRQIYGEP